MNKNWLFGTTALALAASFGAIAPANAQAFKTTNTEVTIGGYTRGFAGAVSADRTTANFQGADVQLDARFDITARFATANGMQALGVIQFQDQGRGSFDTVNNRFLIDSVMRRAYAGIGGAFGQVRVGRDDNASQQTFVGSFDAFTAGSARLGKIYDFIGGSPLTVSADDTGVGSTSIRLFDRQSEKLVYISPRIEGFQLVGSWTPEIAAGRNSEQPSSNGQTYINGLSAGLNFTRPIGSVAVSAYGTYYRWNATNPGAHSTNTSAFKLPDPSAYGFGLNAVWQGIQVGGSYTSYKDVANIARGSYTATDTIGAGTNGLGTATTIIGDSVGYEGGIGYIFGPASVSLNYFKGEADTDRASRSNGVKSAAPLGKDERSALALNGAYTLAPGVSVQLSLFTLKQKSGYYNGFQTQNTGVKNSQKASGAVSALVLAF
ncbi:MAG: porin [Magnetospirillum sp.]|jgi:hypothetical protein|nr:porin [Magnetospirillum sp.]